MTKGYIPAPSGHGTTLFLVVVGIIFLPAAIHALMSIIPVLVGLVVLGLVITYILGRRSIL